MFGKQKLSAAIFRRKKGRFEIIDSCNSVLGELESEVSSAAEVDGVVGSGELEPSTAKQLQAVRQPVPVSLPDVSEPALSVPQRRRG